MIEPDDRHDRSRPWALLALLTMVAGAGPATGGVSLAVNRQITMDGTGTPSENCTGLIATLASLNATSQKPYLVRLEPGTYDCRSGTLTLPPFVDLEGAGRELTTVLVAGAGLRLSDHHELRHLKVIGGTFFAVGGTVCAVSASAGGAPRITHVDLAAEGGSLNCGVRITEESSPVLTDVTIEIQEPANPATNVGIDALSSVASLDQVRIAIVGTPAFGGSPPPGYGVRITGTGSHGGEWSIRRTRIDVSGHHQAFGISAADAAADLVVESSRIRAIGGSHGDALYNEKAHPAVFRSSLLGSSHGLHNVGAEGAILFVLVLSSELEGSLGTIESDSDYAVRVGGSTLAGGPASAGGGTLGCAAVRDENYTFSASTCP